MKRLFLVLFLAIVLPVPALAAPSQYAANSTSTTGTSMSFIMSGEADMLAVCESRSVTGVTHAVSIGGTPMSEVAANTLIAGTSKLWAAFSVATSGSQFKLDLGSSDTAFLACATYQDVRDVGTSWNVAEVQASSTTSLTPALSTVYDDSLLVAGAYRTPGGTSISAGANATAITTPAAGAGLYARTGGTGTAGVWSFGLTASGSTNMGALVIEIPALDSPDVPIGGATSTIEQTQTNLAFAVYIFLISMFGMVWLMRKH